MNVSPDGDDEQLLRGPFGMLEDIEKLLLRTSVANSSNGMPHPALSFLLFSSSQTICIVPINDIRYTMSSCAQGCGGRGA
jgi:hypothetical protein